MSTKVNIINGKYKGRQGKVVGVYMNGKVAVKIGHKCITLKYSSVKYID